MRRYLFIILLLFGCSSPDLVINELPHLPEPVSNNAVVGIQDEGDYFLYSFGGIDETLNYAGIHKRSYRYSSISKSWSKLPDLPDTLGKIASAASRIGDIIYIVGGYYVFEDGHEISSNKVHRYQISTNSFLEDAPPITLAIDDHVQSVWKDSLLFVITGWSNKRNAPATQIFFPGLNSWVMGTPTPYKEEFMSFGASGSIMGDSIFYMGGAQYENFYPAQEGLRVGTIDPETPYHISWRIENTNGRKAYRSASLIIKDQIVWVGGSTTTYNYDGIAYESKKTVQPSHRILSYNPFLKKWKEMYDDRVPMDLRNVAQISSKSFVIVGGIGKDRKVLSQVLMVTLNN